MASLGGVVHAEVGLINALAVTLPGNALQALAIFGEEADILRYISAWFVEREN